MVYLLVVVVALAGFAAGLLLAPRVKAEEEEFGDRVYKLWKAGSLNSIQLHRFFDMEIAFSEAKSRGFIANARLAELDLQEKLAKYPADFAAEIRAKIAKIV